MKYSVFLLVFIFTMFLGCQGGSGTNNTSIGEIDKAFRKALKSISKDESGKYHEAYLVIPNTGCSGCITEAENLLKNSIGRSKKVKFILTNVESLKMIRIKLGINVLNNPEILIDKKGEFYKGLLKSVYPKVYFLDQEKVYKVMEVSPNEDGLGALKDF